MAVSHAGHLNDGRPVRAVSFGSEEGLRAEVLTFGATLRSLTVRTASGRVEVLLQLPTLADYEADTRYLNPVIGRCANRIAEAAFSIGDRQFRVSANEGRNCLHGGSPGWHKRLWTLEAASETGCTLSYVSPDGESGFPGMVQAEVEFELIDASTLQIGWNAQTDASTPVNLTHHLYFDLSGGADDTILQHRLTIAGDRVTPVGAGLIPTGEIRSVDGSVFDLRRARAIGDVLDQQDEQLRIANGVDLNWGLAPGGCAVELTCPTTGVTLGLSTDQPGLQVYTGQNLDGPFRAHQALVLEPQGFPNAVNLPCFPSVLLHPGQRYRRHARYRLTADQETSQD